VRVPANNELPATTGRLIEALGQVETFLASRRLMEVPIVDFTASVTPNPYAAFVLLA